MENKLEDSRLEDMNEMMLDIWKDYLELCSIFTTKIEDIRADEELNVNLALLRASITDLSINLSNFKDNLSSIRNNITDGKESKDGIMESIKSETQNIDPTKEDIDLGLSSENKKKMLALFFMFLMKIDKNSLLNSNSNSNSYQQPDAKPPCVRIPSVPELD